MIGFVLMISFVHVSADHPRHMEPADLGPGHPAPVDRRRVAPLRERVPGPPARPPIFLFTMAVAGPPIYIRFTLHQNSKPLRERVPGPPPAGRRPPACRTLGRNPAREQPAPLRERVPGPRRPPPPTAAFADACSCRTLCPAGQKACRTLCPAGQKACRTLCPAGQGVRPDSSTARPLGWTSG